MPTPIAPSISIVFQFARKIGQSRRTYFHANGARIRIANSHRKNVMAIGGMSACRPRPTIQLQAQKNGVSVSSRYGETLRDAAMRAV